MYLVTFSEVFFDVFFIGLFSAKMKTGLLS